MYSIKCPQCRGELLQPTSRCPACGSKIPLGLRFANRGFEWKSRTKLWRIPLVHIAWGFDEQGKLRIAKGIIAVGQFAVGLITVAQFGVGILFGFGQVMFGLAVLAQIAGGLLIAVGQLAAGVITVGQVVVGIYGLCQTGWARYMWSPQRVDMEAVALYYTIMMRLRELVGL
jgi:hypothetical protein